MDTNKLSNMGRRRFIKTLSALGISGPALNHLSQDVLADLTDDPTKEVPRLLALKHTNQQELLNAARSGKSVKPKREPVYYTIPRDKWVEIETAHDAGRRVEKLITRGANSGSLSPKVEERAVAGVTTKNGEKTVKVYVKFRSWETAESKQGLEQLDVLRDHLPNSTTGYVGSGSKREKITGIPVEVEPAVITPTAFYDEKYRPVPGGCELYNKDSAGVGTSATPAYDQDRDETVMVTCAHLGESGDTMQQPGGSGTTIGSIDKRHEDVGLFDVATILEGTSFDGTELPGTYEIAGDGGGYDYTIDGVLSWTAIKDNEGDKTYDMTSQGRTTGRLTGYIVWAPSSGQEGFILDNNQADGDSGGPAFRIYSSGNSYVAGTLSASWDNDDDGDQDSYHSYLGEAEDRFNLVI